MSYKCRKLKPMPTTTIVLSRIEDDFEVVARGRVDIGERHKTREVKVGKALIWRKGVPESKLAKELTKAEECAKADGYEVFAYPSTEKDPLNRAKRELLARRGVSPDVARLWRGEGKPLGRL